MKARENEAAQVLLTEQHLPMLQMQECKSLIFQETENIDPEASKWKPGGDLLLSCFCTIISRALFHKIILTNSSNNHLQKSLRLLSNILFELRNNN